MVLYVWYDNEYGYSRQVIRLSKYIAEVRRKRYY
jgi:glyceraldehyde 3-phosphate dehydrogenase